MSAYYYTPVHSLFVGSLIALGVVMIALRSDDDLEDLLFNLAGALAFIVAFVPTERPKALAFDTTVVVEADPLITNNMVSMMISLGAALVVAIAFVRRDSGGDLRRPPRATVIGQVISAVLLFILALWYAFARPSFLRYAHGSSAVTMFSFIILAVLVNANWPAPLIASLRVLTGSSTPQPSPHRKWYVAVSGWMVIGGALVVLLVQSSRVFWLEVVETIGFVVFWIVQTVAPPPSSPLSTTWN